jgi:hypothetical protein
MKMAQKKKEREKVKSMVQMSRGMQASPPKIHASGLGNGSKPDLKQLCKILEATNNK